MYEMVVDDQVTSFKKRADAVKAAKEATAQPEGRATANVSDGIETLSFRNGKLIAYSYETRTDRRQRPEQDDSKNDFQAPPASPAETTPAADKAETENVELAAN